MQSPFSVTHISLALSSATSLLLSAALGHLRQGANPPRGAQAHSQPSNIAVLSWAHSGPQQQL